MTILRLWLVAALLGLAGCALTGGGSPAPQTLGQSLAYAQATATAANEMAAGLLDAGQISVGQAKEVLASSEVIGLVVKQARRQLALGDAAGAQAQMLAIAADLAALSEFIQRKKTS